MSNEILEWSVIDYKSTVDLLLQQRGSKLRSTVMTDSYKGKSGVPVNQIGAVNAQKRTNRHGDTPLIYSSSVSVTTLSIESPLPSTGLRFGYK